MVKDYYAVKMKIQNLRTTWKTAFKNLVKLKAWRNVEFVNYNKSVGNNTQKEETVKRKIYKGLGNFTIHDVDRTFTITLESVQSPKMKEKLGEVYTINKHRNWIQISTKTNEWMKPNLDHPLTASWNSVSERITLPCINLFECRNRQNDELFQMEDDVWERVRDQLEMNLYSNTEIKLSFFFSVVIDLRGKERLGYIHIVKALTLRTKLQSTFTETEAEEERKRDQDRPHQPKFPIIRCIFSLLNRNTKPNKP